MKQSITHHSIKEEYKPAVVNIIESLNSNRRCMPITQSLIEIWKLIYSKFSNVVKVKIPDYMEYDRNLVAFIVSVNSSIDWSCIDEADLEYFRVVEYFTGKSLGEQNLTIDLSFYDINDGVYWLQLDPAKVLIIE